ncbi:MAG: cation-translocating P-type ATPase [Planctomyces sp.]|nr:cation-translocating P-type ATPase [Planctomyces sp.]
MMPDSDTRRTTAQPDLQNEDRVVCCTWCSLPVGIQQPTATCDEPIYCCYGCRVAHAITQEKGTEGAVRWTIVRLGISIFFTMNLMAFTMTMWSLDVYEVQPDPFQLKLFEVFRWLSMVFSLPVLLLLGVPLLQNAIESWKNRIYSTDLLIATGVASAYAVSVWNVIFEIPSVYFEVGAMVLLAVTLGRWFEASGKHKATEALDKLAALLPTTAERMNGTHRESIPCSEIQPGDRLRIRAGERFPADGQLISGRTTVDEQVFTGESTPIERTPGDRVLSGTINLDGDIEIRATAGFREGSFGRLLKLLQEARTARGHYQLLADRVSAWFFPIVTLIAVVTFFVHLNAGIGTAIQNALAVLLIACPCALGLATPLAVWTALSTAIRHQVLFRSGEAIERLALADSLCIDKTGTLTTGLPHVLKILRLDSATDETADQQIALALAVSSHHPYSVAVQQELLALLPGKVNENLATSEIMKDAQIRTVSGKGVEATLADNRIARLGSPDFCVDKPTENEVLTRWISQADQSGSSLVAFSVDQQLRMAFVLTESLRDEAADCISNCIEIGIPVSILTGDRDARANHLRKELSHRIPDSLTNEKQPDCPQLIVHSQLSPSDKVKYVSNLRAQGKRTVMVGDGINDAPALAASDMGVAMGCGADVSRESAQVCLLGNDLNRIPWAIELARQTRKVIRQNLMWAFGYNAAGVVVASLGILNPAVAAGLMIVSSLLVITNSLRLMNFSPEIRIRPDQALNATQAEQPTADELSQSAQSDPSVGAGS